LRGKAEELGGSLAIDERFLSDAPGKLHVKRPRYEVDSGFRQARPALLAAVKRYVHFNTVA